MSSIIVPLAEIAGGRAARIRVEADQGGAAVAEFGNRIAAIGDAMETDRLDREAGRARIDVARALVDQRRTFEAMTDPDEIDAGWADTTKALRERLVGSVDRRNADRVGMMFDELADRHAAALGDRALDLRQGEYRINVENYAQSVLAGSAGFDPDSRAAALDQLTDQVASAVAAGAMTPEEANSYLNGQRDQMARTAALRALDENPAGLIASIDAGEFEGLDPIYAEGLRGRATSAVETEAARASAEAERVAAAQAREIGDRLSTVAGNARDGRMNAWEADFLTDPAVQAHPGYAEAAAAVALRDALPHFATLPPAEQAAMIAAERAKPVTERYETNVLKEMETAHAASTAAWDRDPIAQASAIGLMPPPPLPDLRTADPAAGAEALTARRAYALSLHDAGYVERPAFFSVDERAALADATRVGVDPAERARIAGELVAAFGPDAPRALAEIKGDDVFAHMGGLAAAGGDPRLVSAAFQGQQFLDEKLVALPKEAERRAGVDAAFGDLFADDTPMEGRIVRTADALYASRARGVEPDSREARRLYEAALQDALGAGVDARGRQTGGVQRVRRAATLLPIGVTSAQVETGLGVAAAMFGVADDPMTPWRAASASGGSPLYAGQPIDADVLSDVRLRAVGNDVYALYVERRGQRFDLTDDASGRPYAFRLTRLLREVGP